MNRDLQSITGANELAGFYALMEKAGEDNKIKRITLTKENIAQHKDLLENAYNNLYIPTFTDPTEREPFERWVKDIELGTEAENVRLITLFYNDTPTGKKKVTGVAASEIYRTPTKDNPNGATIFPNYYFSSNPIERQQKIDGSSETEIDNRNNNYVPIPAMFFAQLKDAEALTNEMGVEINSIFFEADCPEKKKAEFRKAAEEILGENHPLSTKHAEFLDQLLFNRRQADRIFLTGTDNAAHIDRAFYGLSAEQAGELYAIGTLYAQIDARDRMYKGMLRTLGVEYAEIPNYVQPELDADAGLGRCTSLVGRFIGNDNQARGFINAFYQAFEERSVEEAAKDTPAVAHMVDGLRNLKLPSLKIEQPMLERLGAKLEADLQNALDKQSKPELGKFTARANSQSLGSRAIGG